jgi:prevent-host-death family protein
MITVEINVHQAKTHFSKLLERVALGEDIVIAKAGRPVARLVRFEAAPSRRVVGTAKGRFTVPDDFNEPLPRKILDWFS